MHDRPKTPLYIKINTVILQDGKINDLINMYHKEMGLFAGF